MWLPKFLFQNIQFRIPIIFYLYIVLLLIVHFPLFIVLWINLWGISAPVMNKSIGIIIDSNKDFSNKGVVVGRIIAEVRDHSLGLNKKYYNIQVIADIRFTTYFAPGSIYWVEDYFIYWLLSLKKLTCGISCTAK